MTANAAYVFDIDKIDMELIAKAKAGLIQIKTKSNAVESKLPYTLAQLVIIDETGKTLADVLSEFASEPAQAVQIASGTYIGTGTYGSSNPNRLQLEFAPKFLVVAPQDSTSAITAESYYQLAPTPFIIWAGQPGSAPSEGSGSVQSPNNKVSVSGNSVSWYSSLSAKYQLNTRSSTYYYFAIGEANA